MLLLDSIIDIIFLYLFLPGIEAQIREIQNQRKNLNRNDLPKENERVGFSDVGGYDDDIYSGSKNKFVGYHTSLAIDEADVSTSF